MGFVTWTNSLTIIKASINLYYFKSLLTIFNQVIYGLPLYLLLIVLEAVTSPYYSLFCSPIYVA